MLRARRSRYSRCVALAAALAVAFSGLQLSGVSAASAVDAQSFNAGNIISDSLFYDGNAMSAAEVQSFLNQRVPRCTIGDPGREAGRTWYNTQIAEKCLRDYTMTTRSIDANANCKAYTGRAGESAAQIIAKVGQACGISQQVLLVTLEKEQSVVTDSWPTNRMIDVATGYMCPDSGPGWSANCNPDYYGFQNQVYMAAWQFKNYRLYASSFNFRANQTATIQWNPNPGCGTSQVYIENWATAGLYNYTPYRPNQAALNAGWGTGDSCSSYGNRNFYMFYSTWFGSPSGSYAPIDTKHAQNPWLGTATTGYVQHTVNGGGIVRAYENGAIAWQSGKSSAYILTGEFRNYFGSRGGLSGALGWPTSDMSERSRGRIQEFQGATVSWTSEHGFAALSGVIRAHYTSWALGYDSPLGWPIANESCSTSSNCTQPFERGSITRTGTTAAISIPAIDAVASAKASLLGAVTQTPRAQTAHGGGFVQGHSNGAIAWSPETGAYALTGAIREAFGKAGGIQGSYGWPAGEEQCDANSCSQLFLGGTIRVNSQGTPSPMAKNIEDAYNLLRDSGVDLGASLGSTRTESRGRGGLVHGFENGAIAASDRTGAYAVMAPIRAPFNAAGGLVGPLGWPTGNARFEEANGGGTVQGFEGGAITSSSFGTYVISGSMRSAFGAHGGLAGTLGWLQSNEVQHTVNGGGSVQAFQGGALVRRQGTDTPVLVSGDIRQVFGQHGGLAGVPGWPLAEARSEAANGGGTVQGFQGAAIASSPHGTFLVSGEIRRHFNAQGGLTGALGWPTSTVTSNGVQRSQSFQGGTITWNSQTGEVAIARS